jgi:hypothetical protein
MKMVEFIVLEKLVLGDRFLNRFVVKMANRVFDPCGRLNNMMLIQFGDYLSEWICQSSHTRHAIQLVKLLARTNTERPPALTSAWDRMRWFFLQDEPRRLIAQSLGIIWS